MLSQSELQTFKVHPQWVYQRLQLVLHPWHRHRRVYRRLHWAQMVYDHWPLVPGRHRFHYEWMLREVSQNTNPVARTLTVNGHSLSKHIAAFAVRLPMHILAPHIDTDTR